MVTFHWGVDSSQAVTRSLYDCVLNNYGKPEYWGRYLTRVEGSSEGLTKEEISLLHNSGTKILPIYNDFRRAVGANQGRVVAMTAAYHAKRLGIQKGSPIFMNVEQFFEVDSAWIRGLVNYLYNSDYKPGFYFDSTEGNFTTAYCEAVQLDKKISNQAVLWSAEPDLGVTNVEDAPDYNPATPECDANVWAWQYGHDSEVCPIDTNLVDSRLLQMLY
ncbi:hypothetical protein CD30_13295 [Ureibacillus massiliensis 4400831 = CIP 108448 = CCUG 49529]|uniref:Rv2525c-like glycoside hydrolase-like domain-containing protein n=1 Tax=Ureibacillus massiliensis 4400831 = CIP 108448 = CCUG 49529 TaxID=1211035 RepID=A0A0A3JSX4_9BACL|nr:glycoside hydrolase domain-containing protein [Ureibacillus massiliensis]KGR90122.1 hypothetical protein CD30_13295 [Ureibacillus massiliensis 4400831 = CIP 108448 = CCUG 49529]